MHCGQGALDVLWIVAPRHPLQIVDFEQEFFFGQGQGVGQHDHGTAAEQGLAYQGRYFVGVEQPGFFEQPQGFGMGGRGAVCDFECVGAKIAHLAAGGAVAVVVVGNLGALRRF